MQSKELVYHNENVTKSTRRNDSNSSGRLDWFERKTENKL